MAVITTRQLLESGVHFGHQTRRWNPKMKRFIFNERNGIYIIDLRQSLTYIDKAYSYISGVVARGGQVLFVGTKKQAQETIAEQATRVGMPYVNQRWLGGMLTNFQTINKRITRLKELESMDLENVVPGGLRRIGIRPLQQTIGDSVGDDAGQQRDRTDGVVVARDREVDLVGIAVGVEDADDRDVQLARLVDGEVLALGVDDPDRGGRLLQVADTAQ